MKLKHFSKNLFFIPIAAGALLCSCIASEDEDNKNTNTVDPESSFTYDVNGNVTFFDSTLQEDSEYGEKEFKNTITINFNGTNKPNITPESTEGVEITANEEKGEAHLVIRSEKKINYIVKGSSTNGSLMIFSQKKFKLTLDNLNLSNDAGLPAISSQTKKRCFIEPIGTCTIADAEAHSLGSIYKKDDGELMDAKGAIFSEGELIFVGSGTLNVTGNYNHAICSDQYVRINSSEVTVNVKGAKKDGIHTNDAVLINDGTLNISGITIGIGDENASKKKLNGIQCEKGYIVIKGGKINIESPGIGLWASKDDFSKDDDMTEKSFIYIDGGEINIETSEKNGHGISTNNHLIIKGDNTKISIKALGTSAKGLETGVNIAESESDEEKGQIVLAGGTVKLFSVGKVLDPKESVYIWGGTLNAVGGGVASEKIKASQPCAIASFPAGVGANEKILFDDTNLGETFVKLVGDVKVVVSNSTLAAGSEPTVSIGSKTADTVKVLPDEVK